MKKLLAFFPLLFMSLAAFAGDVPDHLFNPAAIQDKTDISVNYLTQIFGSVGGVLTGSGSQMMGQLFLYLNWGIFSVSAIVIIYAVFMGVLRIATEGATMQQGKSTLFTLLKLAVGVSLIIPSPTTGYSLLQSIVMKVVVEGVALADSIWDNGLHYLDTGGVMWVAPKENGASESVVTTQNVASLLGKGSAGAKVFQSEVCMIASREPISQGASSTYYNMIPDTKTNTLYFPGLGGPNAIVKANDNAMSCGNVSWDIGGACSQSSDAADCAMAQDAVTHLAEDLMPAAKRYYCSQPNMAKNTQCIGVQTFGGSDNMKGATPYLLQAMAGYYSAIKPYVTEKQQKNSADQTRFISNAEKEGWLTAGRYYWDMMQMYRKASDQANLSQYAPSASQVVGPVTQLDTFSSAPDDMASASLLVPIPSTSVSGDKVQEKFSGSLFSPYSYMEVAPTVLVPGIAATLAASMAGLDVIALDFRDFGKDNHQNPIQFFYDIGHKCIVITMIIWLVGALAIAANVMVYAICSAENPLGYGASAMINWVKPLLMLIATMLWAAGFFLCYYIPLYPYMIFLFASVGWFISVIEAMVAAPLVALGLTHPENHDILGKAEQALMLLLGVFLQPALLVVGLIAGIIFSYVTFELLIYTFSNFVLDIMTTPTSMVAGGNLLASVQHSELYTSIPTMLTEPLLLILFCVIAYTLLTQSFSLTYLLRDNVMRWIGAPGSGLPSPEQMVSETKGAVQSAGSQTAKAGSDVGSGSGSMIESAKSTKQAREQQDKSNGGGALDAVKMDLGAGGSMGGGEGGGADAAG